MGKKYTVDADGIKFDGKMVGGVIVLDPKNHAIVNQQLTVMAAHMGSQLDPSITETAGVRGMPKFFSGYSRDENVVTLRGNAADFQKRPLVILTFEKEQHADAAIAAMPFIAETSPAPEGGAPKSKPVDKRLGM